jgi:hypothetical protein
MRNLRMIMPQYVTNVTSFNDAVRILKNKAILTEAALGENSLLDEVTSEMENGASYAEAIAKVAAKHNMDEDKLATMVPEESVGDEIYKDDYPWDAQDNSDDSYPTDYGDPGADFNDGEFWEAKDSSDEDDEVLAMLDKIEKEKEGEEAVMGQYDESLSEGRKKKEKKEEELNPNAIHPQELRMGIRVELEHTDDLDKAKKIAIDHLKENPFYYTQLKLSGVDVKATPSKEKKAIVKKKDQTELVDKENQMKPVPKKKIEEARLNINGEPNEVVKQAMNFVNSNPTLKALSDEIEFQQTMDSNEALLRYDYWDELPTEALDKLELQFNVEVDRDFDEDTGTLTVYRLTPKTTGSSKNLGSSFDKFKSELEEIVREVVNEYYFDGRDNLIDDIAAELD